MPAEHHPSDVEQGMALEQLLEKSRSTDIPVLLQAKKTAKQLVRRNPSSANVAALSRVTAMLLEAEGKMSDDNSAQVLERSGAEPDDTFAHRLEAWQYL
jgi:hypothetical protein